MVAKVVPAFRLVPEPLSEEAAALLDRSAYVDAVVGTRHRLGGIPDLPPDVNWPTCPQGDGPMTFYTQLDGFPGPSEFDLVDAGLIAVYVCFDCFEVRAVLSSA